jgi:hypothetical protein
LYLSVLLGADTSERKRDLVFRAHKAEARLVL